MTQALSIVAIRLYEPAENWQIGIEFVEKQSGIGVQINDFWSEPARPYQATGVICLEDYQHFAQQCLVFQQQDELVDDGPSVEVVLVQPNPSAHSLHALVQQQLRVPRAANFVQAILAFVDEQSQKSTFHLQLLESQSPSKKGQGWLVLLAVLLPYAMFVWGVDWLSASCVK